MTRRQNLSVPPLDADAYFVWARRGNTGDWLIADASERYLRDRGINVWRSDGSLEDAVEGGDTEYLQDIFASFRGMLIFAGGGNVGIYPDNEAVRAGLIAHMRPSHRCLVLPQSALAPEAALLHPGVTIWCRDAVSYELLTRSGARTELVPDAAFYMDDLFPKRPGGTGTFTIKRAPGGDAETIEHGVTYEGPSADLMLGRPLEEVVATLEPYEFVLSDRLHGGLVALMMRKKVIFLPVGYHKIRAFYETWLAGVPGAAFVDRKGDLAAQLRALQPTDCDFAALFRERADPALDRFLLGA